MVNDFKAADFFTILKELSRSKDPGEVLDGFIEAFNHRSLPVTLSRTGGSGDPTEEQIPLESLKKIPANLYQTGSPEALSPEARDQLKGVYDLLDVILENQLLRLERVSLEKQMNESARYVTQGQISRGVAHDFNNYLAGILGYTDLALRKAEEGSPGRQMLELIHENSLKTADFVKQLLQLSRKQGTPWGKVNIQELIEELLPLLHHLIKSDIEIAASIEADLWPFEGDASQIEQIIINLFLNARDAISRGGQISLTAKNHEVSSGRLPGGTACRSGGYVRVTLGDTGCGIAPENLSRVFDPFYTTREPGRGPGLGLTRARRIMLDHGGYIEVESKPSQGSLVHLYFPGIDRIEESPESDLSGQSSRSLPLALLVEDEPIVLEMVTFLLENSGFEVISQGDPLEGMELFRENRDKISLVVSDMIMPNLTGDELVKRLREFKPDVNIILMSGYSDETIQSRLDGRTRFIQKPFSLETFTRVVKDVMGP